MTTQFVSTAPANADIAVAVEVLAAGGRTSQVRVTGTDAAGTVMFASLGATGNLSTEMPSAFFERMPTVSSPEDADRWGGPFATIAKMLPEGVEMPEVPMDVGFHHVLDIIFKARPPVFGDRLHLHANGRLGPRHQIRPA